MQSETLTRKQLEEMVPVSSNRDSAWPVVHLTDIPEPYRSQFESDSVGSTAPTMDTSYAHDWQKWLSIRFKNK